MIGSMIKPADWDPTCRIILIASLTTIATLGIARNFFYDTEEVVAFVARSAADEWDNIIPYDRNSED